MILKDWFNSNTPKLYLYRYLFASEGSNNNMISEIINSLIIIISVLVSIAYITLSERTIMGIMQRRVGPRSLIQPIKDGIKLFTKETIIPQRSDKLLIGPIIILILCLIVWIVVPIKMGIINTDNNYSILYILAISSLNVYIYIFSGWITLSKYANIGSLRSISQLISYEVSIGIIIMNIIILTNSFNLNDLYENQIYIPYLLPLAPIALLFIISILAETNRPPFDLPEAESELIAGYLIEYGGFAFASIYLAEYGFILLLSYLAGLFFFPSLILPFSLFIIFCFIWIRASLPRLRFDHLISLGWNNILPLSISYLFFSSSLLFFSF
jgi:NADH-quinone oxidoreductase subunit H